MLSSLHIENVAVIKSVDIDFEGGFVAMTGETGAGKSIILDSINLLLGKKAERDLIRHGEERAMVSGLFFSLNKTVTDALAASGISPDEDGALLIQRTISADGHSAVKINGRAVSLSVLKTISPFLVAIHGQSDTQALVDAEKQLEMLDIYADNAEILTRYSKEYDELLKIRAELAELKAKLGERERMIEILRYQIEDIESAKLEDGEEDALIEKKLKIKNSEKISKNAGFVFKALRGSEKGSVSFLIDRSITALDQISDVVPNFADYSEKLRDILYQVTDISEEVYAVYSDIDEDPEESLNKIESRLAKIAKLKRKYGATEREILDFKEKCESELYELENSDNVINELIDKEKHIYDKARALAEEIHSRRADSAKILDTEVKNALEFLDMPKVVFYTSIKEDFKGGELVLNKWGADLVEFFISPNRGAEAKPLSKIASGGELARVMLALKSTLADKNSISTLIFDEIDAGVSGKTARKIGIKMHELSASAQIFSVTHSAQIASLADMHFLISKKDTGSGVETEVSLLEREGRIAELSRILGGIAVTEAQKNAAIDMLDERENFQI